MIPIPVIERDSLDMDDEFVFTDPRNDGPVVLVGSTQYFMSLVSKVHRDLALAECAMHGAIL